MIVRFRLAAVSAAVMLLAFGAYSQAPLTPLRLKIVRSNSLGQTLSLADCIPGKLSIVSSFSPTDIGSGSPVSDTLELPWRWNKNDISAIPAGMYSGKIRTEGKLGWRIELIGTGPRTHVQLHVGRRPAHSAGCILLGTATAASDCILGEPEKAIAALKDLYGNNNSRPIEVWITE